jgi:hypothetical protein
MASEKAALKKQFTAQATAASSHVRFPLGPGKVISFASARKGENLLALRDDYMTRLSQFDRAAKSKMKGDISEAEFLESYSKNGLRWHPAEKVQIISAFQKMMNRAPYLQSLLPDRINLVKTTGREESDAAYTRANSIFFPQSFLRNPQIVLDWLVCHETFHVLSRSNPQLRENLYKLIGFEKCNEIELPPLLKHRQISNPDAPINDHFIKITVSGEEHMAVPIIFSKADYDPEKAENFFRYLQFKLLLVEQDNQGKVVPLDHNGSPALLDPPEVDGFFEQVGNNTTYIIHPEEILAENFTYHVYRGEKLGSHFKAEEIDSTLLNAIETTLHRHAGSVENIPVPGI